MILSLADYRPIPRFDDTPWVSARMEGCTIVDGDPWVPIQTYAFSDPDVDPANPKARNFTAENVSATVAFLRIVFVDGTGGESVTDPISVAPLAGTLCSLRDVRGRLGQGDLTAEQETQCQTLILFATIGIYAVLAKPSTWQPPAGTAGLLGLLATELVCRSMANPQALGQQSETIGAYSHTTTFAREIPGSGILLTPAEELLARRVVYGATTASIQVRSLADDYADTVWFPTIFYGLLAGADEDEPSDIFMVWK